MLELQQEQLRSMAQAAVADFTKRWGLPPAAIFRAELDTLTEAGWYHSKPNTGTWNGQLVWCTRGAYIRLYWHDKLNVEQHAVWWVPCAVTDLGGFEF